MEINDIIIRAEKEIKVSYNAGYRRNENITPQIYQQEISYAIHINRKRTVDR